MKLTTIPLLLAAALVIYYIVLATFSGVGMPPDVDLHGCIRIASNVMGNEFSKGDNTCIFERQTPAGRDALNINVYDPHNPDSNEYTFSLAYILQEKSEGCKAIKKTASDEPCCWDSARIFLSTENNAYACETMGAV